MVPNSGEMDKQFEMLYKGLKNVQLSYKIHSPISK